MRNIVFVLILFSQFLNAQNTIGGQDKKVPEEEVKRQSDFVDAEKERILGHYDKALDLYKRFLYENTANDAAWYGQARTHEGLKDMQAALESIAKAIELAPENQWYYLYQAQIYENIGQTRDAARVYTSLTKKYPNIPEFWEHLAYLQVASADPQNALKSLEKLEKLTGIDEDLCTSRHLIYVGMGDKKKAAAELLRLADTYPARLEYRHRLAHYYEETGDQAAAAKTYEDILRREPNDAEAKLALSAKQNAKTGDAAALDAMKPQFADPRTPLDAKIKQLMPYLGKLQERPDAALSNSLINLGRQLEQTHPDDPQTWSVSGDILYLSDRPAEALENYRRCIGLNPKVFSVWDNLLTILHSEKQYDELLSASDKAIDAFPNQPKAYYFNGIALAEKNRAADAASQFDQALLMAGNNLPLRLDITDQIGLLLLRQKDFAGARSKYEAALAKGGDKHPGILEHLGDALQGSGDNAQAREFWKKAYDLGKSPSAAAKLSAN